MSAAQIAAGLSEAAQKTVLSLPVVRGARAGMFWASNDADVLADLSHQRLCKMPFADNVGHCDWQFVARISTLGEAVRAELLKEQP